MKAGMWKWRSGVWLGLALVVSQVALASGGCTAKVVVPNEARLKERFNALLKASHSGDYDTVYEMKPPHLRTSVTREKFLEDMSAAGASPVTRGEFKEFCWCKKGVGAADPSTVRCLAIVSITWEKPGGQEETANILDIWDYEDGEWYHFWSDQRDECPQRQ